MAVVLCRSYVVYNRLLTFTVAGFLSRTCGPSTWNWIFFGTVEFDALSRRSLENYGAKELTSLAEGFYFLLSFSSLYEYESRLNYSHFLRFVVSLFLISCFTAWVSRYLLSAYIGGVNCTSVLGNEVLICAIDAFRRQSTMSVYHLPCRAVV